jgi:hypothetical protein
MVMDVDKFIYCKDADVAQKLSYHFPIVSKRDNLFIFLNQPLNNQRFDYSNIDKSVVAFGNKLIF